MVSLLETEGIFAIVIVSAAPTTSVRASTIVLYFIMTYLEVRTFLRIY